MSTIDTQMDLRRLESFLAVAECGGFSRAAARLHRSQSAVSTHVQQLEAELGVALFERTSRRVALTAEGRRYAERTSRALAELRDAAGEMGERAAGRRAHVAIGTVASISAGRLPAVFAAFQRKHPDVTLEVREASATGIHTDLRDRATDFAVAPRLGSPDDLAHVPVLADRFVAVLPAGLVAGDRPVTLAELGRHPQLAQLPGTAVRARVEAEFRAAGLDYRPSIVVAHHHTVLRMIRARLGVSLLPSICLHGEPRDGLDIRALRGRAVVREICIVTRRGAVLSPAAAACAEAIAEALQPRASA